jgi:two-component system, NarL family, invasion response regulator UvrY
MRVLIADDHPVVRHGLKQILASESKLSVVGEAKNGNEALEMARQLDWDVAVVDYSMPGMSGLELLKEFKREHPNRPVLILSMYPEEVHATRVLKAGAAGYLNKASACEELAHAIRKIAGGGKYISPSLAEKMVFELGPDARKPLHEELSDREYRVMWLLASGKQVKQIAKEMFLSASTISTYRSRIFRKLQLTSNAGLVRYAIKHQLME